MDIFQKLSVDNRNVLICMGTFLGSHTIMSHHSIREKLIKASGSSGNFTMVYSLISIAQLIPAAYLYFKRTKGTGDFIEFLQQNKDLFSKIGLFFAMNAAFHIPLISTGKLVKPDMNKQEKDKFGAVDSLRGVLRITRHPLFWMMTMLCSSQIFRGQRYSDVYFYLPLVIEAIFGALHQDQRLRNWYSAEFYEHSSWFPFVAILKGKQSLSKAINEIGYPRLVVSTILSAITYWYLTKK